MTFLVDNQLPAALARFIAASGVSCLHVQDIQLDTATDAEIWDYARSHDMAIVTKDEDFQAMANRQGSIPPQVVWVRLGNCRKVELLAAFERVLPSLTEALGSGVAVVEIR